MKERKSEKERRYPKLLRYTSQREIVLTLHTEMDGNGKLQWTDLHDAVAGFMIVLASAGLSITSTKWLHQKETQLISTTHPR